jgi:hypothetical protein
MPHVSRLAVLAVLAAAFGLAPVLADADTAPPIPKLEKHPYFDAKPGEYIRLKRFMGGEEQRLVVRVLDTKLAENKVFVEVWQTTDDDKEDKQVISSGSWVDIPEFKPKEHQKFLKDEMITLEVNGKKLACRHIKIEERVNPKLPHPLKVREIWYSNDALGSGKIKETDYGSAGSQPQMSQAYEWGMMSPEHLERRRNANDLTTGGNPDYKPEDKPGEKPPEKPPEKPGDGKPGGG